VGCEAKAELFVKRQLFYFENPDQKTYTFTFSENLPNWWFNTNLATVHLTTRPQQNSASLAVFTTHDNQGSIVVTLDYRIVTLISNSEHRNLKLRKLDVF